MTATIEIPDLRLTSRANAREHWSVRSRRDRREKDLVHLAFYELFRTDLALLRGAPRIKITLTRVGGRGMDDDNLQGAFKAVRDAVAQQLQKDDKPGSGLEWEYAQVPAKNYGVRITLAPLKTAKKPRKPNE